MIVKKCDNFEDLIWCLSLYRKRLVIHMIKKTQCRKLHLHSYLNLIANNKKKDDNHSTKIQLIYICYTSLLLLLDKFYNLANLFYT